MAAARRNLERLALQQNGKSLGRQRSRMTIFALVKLTEQREHAEDLIAGRMFMNTLAYFRDIERTDQHRGDSREAIAAIFQPKEVGSIRFGDAELRPDDLAGPIIVTAPDEWNVFCMVALTDQGFEHGISAASLPLLKRAVLIDQQLRGFGSHLTLVRDVAEFRRRVTAGIRAAGLEGMHGLVEYFDDSHHGWFPSERIPFHKGATFRYQREYRIAVRRAVATPAPFILNVGDLSDILMLTTVEQFNSQLQLRLPDGTTA